MEIMEEQIGAKKKILEATEASFEILKNKSNHSRHICFT
jgi:hypothetical protein